MKSLTEQLECARRELALRQRVYPNWVGSGKMSGDKARHETDCMAGIVATLERAVLLEEVSREMISEEEAKAAAQHRAMYQGELQPGVL